MKIPIDVKRTLTDEEWFVLGFESAGRFSERFSPMILFGVWHDTYRLLMSNLEKKRSSNYLKGLLAGYDSAWGLCP